MAEEKGLIDLMWIFEAATEIRQDAMADEMYQAGHGENAIKLMVIDTGRYAEIIARKYEENLEK